MEHVLMIRRRPNPWALLCAFLVAGLAMVAAPAAHAAEGAPASVITPASYSLVGHVELEGRHINLWLNTANGGRHGQIANAFFGETVWLAPCTNCVRYGVPQGGSYANTPEKWGEYQACGAIARGRTACTGFPV
jgi:hypothetical protein